MTSIGATSLSALGLLRPNLFTKTDTDQSGTVSKDEFVAGRPKNISEAQAAELYAKIDTDGTNALTEDQLKAGLEANKPAKPAASGSSLSSDMLGALLDLMKSVGAGESERGQGKRGGPPDAAEMFAKMDADGDGSVTKAEFIAARPSDVSEDDATSFYDSIDTEGTGSITSDQFAAAKPPEGGPRGAGGPPPGGPPPGAQASDETDETGETTDAASNVSAALAKLLEAIKAYAETSTRSTTGIASLMGTELTAA